MTADLAFADDACILPCVCTRVHPTLCVYACACVCVCTLLCLRVCAWACVHSCSDYACIHVRARIRGSLGHFVADSASAARDSVQNGSRIGSAGMDT